MGIDGGIRFFSGFCPNVFKVVTVREEKKTIGDNFIVQQLTAFENSVEKGKNIYHRCSIRHTLGARVIYPSAVSRSLKSANLPLRLQ